jgi:two-component system, chemotaxis family, sensor kinase CheA
VGLDVVTRNIEAMGGDLEVASSEGRGTTITLRIPLTLTILSGLSVGAAGEIYVIPLDAVVECLQMPEEERLRRFPTCA